MKPSDVKEMEVKIEKYYELKAYISNSEHDLGNIKKDKEILLNTHGANWLIEEKEDFEVVNGIISLLELHIKNKKRELEEL